VEENAVLEVTVGPEPQVIEVLDTISSDPVLALVGMRSPTAGFVVSTVSGQFLMQKTSVIDPHTSVIVLSVTRDLCGIKCGAVDWGAIPMSDGAIVDHNVQM
jgi:hypothetical protein